MNVGLFDSFSLEIYPFTIYLSVGQSDNEFLESIIENELLISEDYMEHSYGKLQMLSSFDIIFRLREYPESFEDESIVSHESLHAVFRVMETIGIEHNQGSEEAFTYLLGYIVRKVKEIYSEKLLELNKEID